MRMRTIRCINRLYIYIHEKTFKYFHIDLKGTLSKLNGTLLELNMTLLELNGTLLELNVTLLELDGTLLENNRTVPNVL